MRVTPAAKEATRQRIRESARKLFQTEGFEATTTRDIAREAGIAAGTMFNYYSSKEALVLEFVRESLDEAEAVFQKRVQEEMPLHEELFLLIATSLRQMRSLRGFLRPALEIGFSPASEHSEEGTAIRIRHLETVAGILQEHQPGQPPTSVQLQMYWMLFTGLLAFWVGDGSPKQEDTLALLDHSMHMYVTWLASASAP